MEIDPTPLGHFASLPVEIRERTWLNFLPCGEDSEGAKYDFEKDLAIFVQVVLSIMKYLTRFTMILN